MSRTEVGACGECGQFTAIHNASSGRHLCMSCGAEKDCLPEAECHGMKLPTQAPGPVTDPTCGCCEVCHHGPDASGVDVAGLAILCQRARWAADDLEKRGEIGAATRLRHAVDSVGARVDVAGWLREVARYLWPKDKPADGIDQTYRCGLARRLRAAVQPGDGADPTWPHTPNSDEHPDIERQHQESLRALYQACEAAGVEMRGKWLSEAAREAIAKHHPARPPAAPVACCVATAGAHPPDCPCVCHAAPPACGEGETVAAECPVHPGTRVAEVRGDKMRVCCGLMRVQERPAGGRDE